MGLGSSHTTVPRAVDSLQRADCGWLALGPDAPLVRHRRSLGCRGACAAARPLDLGGARHRPLAARVPDRERPRAGELPRGRGPVPARAADPRGRVHRARAARAARRPASTSRGRSTSPGLFLVLGVGVLGLADDAFAGASRGWRGHGAASLSGGFNTGALKAVGTLGLALTLERADAAGHRALPARGRRHRAGDERLQPAGPAAGPLGQGVRAARRGADDRRERPRAAARARALGGPDPRRRRARRARARRCSATPAATSSASSRASGSCSSSTPPASRSRWPRSS